MWRRERLLLGIGLILAGCVEPIQPSSPDPISVSIVSGGEQTWKVGEELPQALVVRVTRSESGNGAVSKYLVNFRVVSGGGSVFAGTALTDANGFAREYWTLGPLAGENVLEVRAVDPTTGEKRLFGRFVAHGVVPGPEICNGLDDDFSGTADNPSWMYCLNGVPAPHTDGQNTCVAGFFDLNANAADGCEQLVAGTWTLAPTVTLTCPDFSPLLTSLTVSGATITFVSPTELRIKPIFQLGGLAGFVDDFIAPAFADAVVPVTLVPGVSTVAGSATFQAEGVASGFNVKTTGAVSLSAAFTGPGSFEATLSLSLDIRISGGVFPGGFELGGPCNDVNVTVTGTRTGP